MRYWIILGDDCKGPFDADQVALVHGVGPDTRVCPEGLNPLHPQSWQPAHRFSDIRIDLVAQAAGHWAARPAPRGGGAWKLWVTLALVALGYFATRLPSAPTNAPEVLADAPAPRPAQSETIYEEVIRSVVPADDPALGPASRLDLETTLADGGYLLRWTPRQGGQVSFRYDPDRKILTPLDAGAQNLLRRRR